MNPAFIWIGAGALGAYGYSTGRISDWIDNFGRSKKNESSSQHQEGQQSQQPNVNQQRAPPPTIIVSPSSNNRSSYLLPLGCACFVGLGGYYWFIHSNGTKKVIGKVEETAEETQDLVTKCDENNIKRFEVLDRNNEDRAVDLELNIRSEQRSGFHVVSEQLYGLTQVCIQTLSVL
eukprot:393210_1